MPDTLIAFLFLVVLPIGCSNPSSSTQNGDSSKTTIQDAENTEESKPLEDIPASDFQGFLIKFSPNSSMQNWPQDAQDPLVLNGDVFSGNSIEPILSVTFSELGPGFSQFIPVSKIKQLHPEEPETKNPLESFRFFAFEKIDKGNFWIMSLFAMKKERNVNNEYFAHPFVIFTYSKDGKFIDDFVWWKIDQDMLEVWDYVEVINDTLMVGNKTDMNEDVLSEVWQKTILDDQGKFQTLYSNFP